MPSCIKESLSPHNAQIYLNEFHNEVAIDAARVAATLTSPLAKHRLESLPVLLLPGHRHAGASPSSAAAMSSHIVSLITTVTSHP